VWKCEFDTGRVSSSPESLRDRRPAAAMAALERAGHADATVWSRCPARRRGFNEQRGTTPDTHHRKLGSGARPGQGQDGPRSTLLQTSGTQGSGYGADRRLRPGRPSPVAEGSSRFAEKGLVFSDRGTRAWPEGLRETKRTRGADDGDVMASRTREFQRSPERPGRAREPPRPERGRPAPGARSSASGMSDVDGAVLR